MTDKQNAWDRFAAAAIAGLLADPHRVHIARDGTDVAQLCSWAGRFADAMLAERLLGDTPRARQHTACDALARALEAMKHGDGCYCEAAFSGPGCHPRHSPECEAARDALARYEGEAQK